MTTRKRNKDRTLQYEINQHIASCNESLDQFESYLEVANSELPIAMVDAGVITVVGEMVIYSMQQQLKLDEDAVKHIHAADVGKILFQEFLISAHMSFIKNDSPLAMPIVMLADQIPEFKELLLDRIEMMDTFPAVKVNDSALAEFRFDQLNRRILSKAMQYVGGFIDSLLCQNPLIESLASKHVLTIAENRGIYSIVSIGDMMALEYIKLAHSLAEYTLVNSDADSTEIPEIIDEVNHSHLKSMVKRIIGMRKRKPSRRNEKLRSQLYFMPYKHKYKEKWYGDGTTEE